ncbi:hypothetical protein FHW12_000890 [Dokdonella fugitiva]|uniref:Uncharacterized protein n=1 Tax=Dokdonella fugitiva TaxID=328517 RepID=A0A839EYE4_9GAMM|nr:hypothetical protein [Dokdonella fugitiva]MBA8886699.1 hypothetical protein [Dokdonella fugitiva]
MHADFIDPTKAIYYPWFVATWCAMSLGGLAFFAFNRDAALKRRLFLPILLFSNVTLLAFMLLTGAPGEFLLVAVPMLALITVLNLRAVRFCDGCGRTLHS